MQFEKKFYLLMMNESRTNPMYLEYSLYLLNQSTVTCNLDPLAYGEWRQLLADQIQCCNK